MLQDLAIQALNLSLMFSVGLELDLGRLRAALGRRWLLLACVALNFGLVPLIAAGLGHVFALPQAVVAGLLLAAVAPGGGTGTLLTRTAGANLELSVVLLGVFTALAVPLVPALALALVPDQSLQLWPLLRTLLLFQLLPLALGLGIRLARPALAARLDRLARPLSNVIFGGLVLGLLATKGQLVFDLGLGSLAAQALTVAASLLAPLALPGPRRDRLAVALTTAVRNLSLALLLASAFFDEVTMLAVLTYGLVMYLVGVPVAVGARRRAVR